MPLRQRLPTCPNRPLSGEVVVDKGFDVVCPTTFNDVKPD